MTNVSKSNHNIIVDENTEALFIYVAKIWQMVPVYKILQTKKKNNNSLEN